MLVSGQAWPLQGPVALGQAIAAASRDPRGPRRQPTPCTASPAAAAPEIVDTTPKVVSTVSIPVRTSEAPQMAAPLPSLPEPPPLPAKPTKPSKWWMLLLIIPAIATGLATLFKNFRRPRLAGHFDLMGDNITQYRQRRNTPITPACSNRPSSSLTTFDSKSLEIRELAEVNEWLIAFGAFAAGRARATTHALYAPAELGYSPGGRSASLCMH